MRHRLKTKRRKRRRRTRNRRRKRKRNPKRPSEKKGMRRICWIKKKKKNPFIRTSADDDDGGKCRLKRKKTQNSCSAVHFYFDSLLTFFLFFFKHNSSGQIFFYFAAYSDFYLQIFSRFFFLFKGKWGGETFEHFSGTTKATRVAIFKRSNSPKWQLYNFCFFFRPEMIGSRWKEICWWVRIITMREIIFFEKNVMLIGLICLRLGANLCLTESLIFVILFPDYFVECCRTSGRCFWMCAGHRKTQDNWLRLIFDDIFLVNLWRKRLWPKLSCVMKRREQKESFSPFF